MAMAGVFSSGDIGRKKARKQVKMPQKTKKVLFGMRKEIKNATKDT